MASVEVVVIAEGKTEEQFIKQVVAPALRPLAIYLKPRLLPTSKGAKGGAVSFDRLRYHARNTLNMSSTPILSTFLDLQGLRTDFPGFQEAGKIANVGARVDHLETALCRAIVEESGCRPGRFLPHIQPFEFEVLLFSDVAGLCTAQSGWGRFRGKLTEIRQGFESPEHINGGYDTKPSKRLEDTLLPKYDKISHGPLAAKAITLAVMERECAHFRQWMDKLRGIADGNR
uniref:DUF4276 family protein n=1 Tax=Candidatus Kentrum sp. MB TaxID=2138164 RepID=A0A450XDA8_9GAMM|nr:MAG: protein of unknown function (DUF4276) [Candidatus Kentron sp. MB]VFK31088.1 MAG: protein of unknown function (DUF4276) [Candidatus Kentron sp. MB]VFK75513.1 MAG: protein of unknown function (DUF4276) [Candidatus Kentron sp. MB]